MKNVYMTPLNYENFNGVKKSVRLHFHVTPREFADWMLAHPEESELFQREFELLQEAVDANPEGNATKSQIYTMLRIVKVLAEIGYGTPSDDGEYFDKSETSKFAYSAAYEAFRLMLFEKPKELQTFITTLLNDDVIGEFTTAINSASAELVELPQPKNPDGEKSPQEMSHEELLAAYQAKNQQ